jgi:hypothetical protein
MTTQNGAVRYSAMIRTLRETNERTVKIQKCFDEGGIENKRESRTECGVLVRDECMRGVQKRVTFENDLHTPAHQCAQKGEEVEDHRVLNGLFSLQYIAIRHIPKEPLRNTMILSVPP